MNLKKYVKSFEGKTPPDDSVQAIDSAIEKITTNADIEDWFQAYARNHKRRLAFDHDTITKKISSDEPILECGAAPFILTVSLAAAGHDVTALDIHPDRFKETIQNTKIKVAKCDVENELLPFADETFGCVLFNQLFEHLRVNPIKTMAEVLRVLKPGSLLFLSTPNLRSIKGLTNLLKYQTAFSCENGVFEQYKKLETLGHMGHVREYTAAEVCDFLEKTGYEVLEVMFRGKFANKRHALAAKMFPTFKPQMCIIARRPEK